MWLLVGLDWPPGGLGQPDWDHNVAESAKGQHNLAVGDIAAQARDSVFGPVQCGDAQERGRWFVRNGRKSMSQSVNKVILVGFLGGSPEVRFTAQGKAVARFSLAVNERWKDSEGAPQETVQWFRIVSFGRLAEICGEYLTKGGRSSSKVSCSAGLGKIAVERRGKASKSSPTRCGFWTR